MVSDRQLIHWYNKYNHQWFGGSLPSDTIIYWEPPLDAYAVTCPVYEVDAGKFLIKLNPAIKAINPWWKLLILHEQVHIKLWPKHPKHQHGKLWQDEMIRLANAGAMKNLW